MPIAEGSPDIYRFTDCGTIWKRLSDKTGGWKYYPVLKGKYIPFALLPLYSCLSSLHRRMFLPVANVSEVCPTHAIALSDEGKIETEITKCIKCCVCVKKNALMVHEFWYSYTPMLHQNVRHAVNLNYFIMNNRDKPIQEMSGRNR